MGNQEYEGQVETSFELWHRELFGDHAVASWKLSKIQKVLRMRSGGRVELALGGPGDKYDGVGHGHRFGT